MGECRVCGTPILLEGRCYSCSTGAMDGYEAAVAERDRLAAENAELRKAVAETEQACSELSDELSQIHQLELEAKCHGDLEESHKIMVHVVAERDAELAAANATLDEERAAYAVLLESHEIILDALTESDAALDALREAVQSDEWIYAKHTDTDGQMERIEDILYPQPKETTDDAG